jgi:hypothetical protein
LSFLDKLPAANTDGNAKRRLGVRGGASLKATTSAAACCKLQRHNTDESVANVSVLNEPADTLLPLPEDCATGSKECVIDNAGLTEEDSCKTDCGSTSTAACTESSEELLSTTAAAANNVGVNSVSRQRRVLKLRSNRKSRYSEQRSESNIATKAALLQKEISDQSNDVIVTGNSDSLNALLSKNVSVPEPEGSDKTVVIERSVQPTTTKKTRKLSLKREICVGAAELGVNQSTVIGDASDSNDCPQQPTACSIETEKFISVPYCYKGTQQVVKLSTSYSEMFDEMPNFGCERVCLSPSSVLPAVVDTKRRKLSQNVVTKNPRQSSKKEKSPKLMPAKGKRYKRSNSNALTLSTCTRGSTCSWLEVGKCLRIVVARLDDTKTSRDFGNNLITIVDGNKRHYC